MKWIARYLLLIGSFAYTMPFLLLFTLAIQKTDRFDLIPSCVIVLCAWFLFGGIGSIWCHICKNGLLICDGSTLLCLALVYSIFPLLALLDVFCTLYSKPTELVFALFTFLLTLALALPYLVGLFVYKRKKSYGYFPPSRTVAIKMIALYVLALLLPCTYRVLGWLGCENENVLYPALLGGCMACFACVCLAGHIHQKEIENLSCQVKSKNLLYCI